MGSSSNRYAPRLPQQETKSSRKLLALTDPILGPENLLKTGFAQKGLPSTSECPEGINFPPRGNGGKKKKKSYGFSLHSSAAANTGIVKQSAKQFALRGWTSGGTIFMSHFTLSLLDSSVTRGVLGMRNQASLFNGTRAIAIRPFLFPRVPWVMEKVTATRIEVLRPLRTDLKHQKQ